MLTASDRPNRTLYFTQQEVATLLRVSISYVNRACKLPPGSDGYIPNRHIGRRVVIPRQALQERFPEITDGVIAAAFPTSPMVTTGELVARHGINATDITRWVKEYGILRPHGGGGSGNYYEFDALDEAVIGVLIEWRQATKRRGVPRLIGWAAHAQLNENPDAIVAVPLSERVVVTFGREAS